MVDRRGVRGVGAVWGLCGVLGLGAPGCAPELPVAALEEAVEHWFGRDGITLQSVACPHALAKARDELVVCKAVVGSEGIDVTVTVTDDEGGLGVRPSAVVVVAARAEPEIAATLRGQGHAVASVRCEGQAWVARAGAEHRCEVTDEDGRRYQWHGVWTGDGTKQRTRVVPLGAAGGGGS